MLNSPNPIYDQVKDDLGFDPADTSPPWTYAGCLKRAMDTKPDERSEDGHRGES